MPLQLQHHPDQKFTTVRATGTLEKSDYQHFATDFDRLAAQYGKLRVLFEMTHFDGWTSGALWNEIKFDANHFDQIERLAAVGAKTWEQGLLQFAKPFTEATIRYFDESESAAAQAWLTQN